jgi:hypothetical protein
MAILLSGWSNFTKIFSYETAWANEPKLGRKHVWKVVYKAWRNVLPIPHCVKEKVL